VIRECDEPGRTPVKIRNLVQRPLSLVQCNCLADSEKREIDRGGTQSVRQDNMRTKAKHTEAPRERTVSFASVILAFSLFGFLWPHDKFTKNNVHDFKTQKDSQELALPRDSRPDWAPISFPW
jgi:hypothetical protein